MDDVLSLILAFAPAAQPRDLRSRELLSTVAVAGSCARPCTDVRERFGTGEIVARRADGRLVVLTARHVVADMTEPRVYLRNDASEGTLVATAVRARGDAATVVAQDARNDLALVEFRPAPGDRYAVAALATTAAPASGDVVGGPYGALWTVSPYRAVGGGGESLVSCATCGPGDSGGGVFDERGALAGILVSQQIFVKDGEPRAFATRSSRFKIVPLDDLRPFVAALPGEVPGAETGGDPWSRFDRSDPSPGRAPGDPWARFDAGRRS